MGSKFDTSSFVIASIFICWLAEVIFLGISSRRAHGNCISQILANENAVLLSLYLNDNLVGFCF